MNGLELFRVGDLRPITDQWLREEISYSRMVEMINEVATNGFPTPIKCKKTGIQLFIGDMVKGSQNQYGTLFFEDYLNQYVIRTETGGNIKTTTFEKVHSLQKNTTNNRVECRSSCRLKPKW